MAAMFPKAAARALNKINAQVFTLTKRTIREKYNIQASKLGTRFDRARATPTNLAVGIRARGRPLSLAYFGARWRHGSAGTSVEVIRGRRKVIAGTFIAKTASGHTGVFRLDLRGESRRERYYSKSAGRFVKSKQLPISEKFTISGAEMMAAARVQQVVDRFVNDKLPAVLQHEIDWERSK